MGKRTILICLTAFIFTLFIPFGVSAHNGSYVAATDSLELTGDNSLIQNDSVQFRVLIPNDNSSGVTDSLRKQIARSLPLPFETWRIEKETLDTEPIEFDQQLFEELEQMEWPDTDDDGLKDDIDLCPYRLGASEDNGCPSVRSDSYQAPSSLENCSETSGAENCPGRSSHEKVDLNDDDDDGLENYLDFCPAQTGLPEFSGCPAPKVAYDSWEGADVYPRE